MIKKGDIITGWIRNKNKNGLFVSAHNNIHFFIPLNLISDLAKYQRVDTFNIKDKINFVVVSFDQEKQHGIGSFKENHPLYLRSPYKALLFETKNGFKNIKESFDKFIEEYEPSGDK